MTSGTQADLFPIVESGCAASVSIEDRFRRFHAENPAVYSAIVKAARKARAMSYRVGMKAVFEHLRWRWREQTHGDEYRLNNDFTSHYARLVMRQEPDLDGFFETRGTEGG